MDLSIITETKTAAICDLLTVHGYLDFSRVHTADVHLLILQPIKLEFTPAHFRDNSLSHSTFKRHRETYLLSSYYHMQRVWVFLADR